MRDESAIHAAHTEARAKLETDLITGKISENTYWTELNKERNFYYNQLQAYYSAIETESVTKSISQN